jgi:streptogramin lyase
MNASAPTQYASLYENSPPTTFAKSPTSVIDVKSRVWIADPSADALFSMPMQSNEMVGELRGSKYHLNAPDALVSVGSSFWVANSGGGGSLVEMNAFGVLQRIVAGAAAHLSTPAAMIFAGGRLWVANRANSSISELNPSSGAFEGVLSAPSLHLHAPSELSTSTGEIWVLSPSTGTLTELNATSGVLVRVLSGAPYGLAGATSMVSAAGRLFIANPATRSLTVIDTSTGALIAVIGSEAGLRAPASVATDGTHVFVADRASSLVSEFSASSLAWMWATSPAVNAYGLKVSGSGSMVWSTLYGTNQVVGTQLGATGGRVVLTLPNEQSQSVIVTGVASTTATVWASARLIGYEYLDEFNASTGELIANVDITSLGANPAMVATPQGVWLANYASGPLVHVSADGTATDVTGANCDVNNPSSITYASGYLWITNNGDASVTEVDPSTGACVRNISGSAFSFSGPDAVASDGTHLWVLNSWNDTVTELTIADGSFVRTLSDPSYGFDQVTAIASDGANVWVSNYANSTVTEVSSATAALESNYGPSDADVAQPQGLLETPLGLLVLNNEGASNGTLFAP